MLQPVETSPAHTLLFAEKGTEQGRALFRLAALHGSSNFSVSRHRGGEPGVREGARGRGESQGFLWRL
jgi:hypothetical protein